MADKSWMLNPKAIRHANECIHIIKEKQGTRLKLSQSDFLQKLQHYADTLHEKDLSRAYSELVAMAGVGSDIEAMPAKAVVAQASGNSLSRTHHEMIEVNGQMYPKYRNGQEFKGVNQGIPNYG
ncbi:hypothetical protein [Agaribacterium haliotis]|uniref:hypothetical protein n=1 Tax=Agaribacterium haliotis TaxID=2013869 RepID=UPI000BB586AC|nr:hypothetical protein [Agaribacterium haliotis]